MSHITIGHTGDGHAVRLDLDVLISTRLLLQANSGAGKSFALRRLMEQLYGHVQVIAIDPEGEFASLREKYGYALVGKGGETPADVRSAAMLAHKLLEFRISAVCDLYEMKPGERHAWVRLFLESLVNAPKALWHPLVLIVDEAQIFSPESASGSSEAKEAMIDLTSRGRKRGYCSVWATQRLAKVDKDATSMLQNRLVGGTFEDVDIKRALDLLSVAPEDKREVAQELKTLEPGWFYAFGRALSKERLLFKVDPVDTSHPKPGSARHAAAPPPAPEQIKDLLPKLTDLPKAAEEEARTLAEMKREIRKLKEELRSARTGPAATPAMSGKAGRRELPEARKAFRARIAELEAVVKRQWKTLQFVARQAGETAAIKVPEFVEPRAAVPEAIRVSEAATLTSERAYGPANRLQYEGGGISFGPSVRGSSSNGDGLTGPEQRILNAIAWMNTIGTNEPQQTAVAFLAGYTTGGGAWNNPRGRLHTRGLVRYLSGARIALTDLGIAAACAPDVPLDSETLQRMVLERLPGPESKILRVLLDERDGLDNGVLAERSGYAVSGGAFNNPRGRLRSLGLIDYRDGKVVPAPLLFLE